MVSEYTCGLRYVKPSVFNITDDNGFLVFLMLKFKISVVALTLFNIKLSKRLKVIYLIKIQLMV